MSMLRTLLAALLLSATACTAHAGEVAVAVAANFVSTAQRIVSAFETRQPHTVTMISGATGTLAAQIVHGAPFDILLAADQARPQWLESEGLAVAGSRFTYALGSLALCARTAAALRGSLAEALAASGSIAAANPELAPYGRAAHQVIDRLVPAARLHLITGQSVGQVYGFLASGNVELGFVARAQVTGESGTGLFCTDVPTTMHDPISQDAVLLTRASTNEAAVSFLAFLKSQPARDLIIATGYGLTQ